MHFFRFGLRKTFATTDVKHQFIPTDTALVNTDERSLVKGKMSSYCNIYIYGLGKQFCSAG